MELIVGLRSRLSSATAWVAALVRRAPVLPPPGQTAVWWNTFTGDGHYYRLVARQGSDAQANGGNPWQLELFRDRQFYDRKHCPDAERTLALSAAWKRMVRQGGHGRVYWTGAASMGRFDILSVARGKRWCLLVFVENRYVETREYANEAQAIAAGSALETELRGRPWY